MATAPPVVPSLPTPTPDRFGGEEFDNQMQAWLSAFPGWTAGANNLATWSNTTAAEVATLVATANTKAWEANASADAAWTSRLAAQGYSDATLGYRNEANAAKNAAAGSAAAAATSATNAGDSANAAAASAASIAGGPVASLVGLTGVITQAQFNATVAPNLPVSTATQTALDGKVGKTSLMLPIGADLNTVVTSGFYVFDGTLVNGPAGVQDSAMTVSSPAGASSVISQTIVSYATGESYVRGGYVPGNAWSPWRQLATTTYAQAAADARYGKNNILGVVSQTAGVPTGAVFETITNSNGTATRFANGLQICVHVFSLAATSIGQAAWTFPATFATSPFASMNMEQGTTTNPTTQGSSLTYSYASGTSATFTYSSPSGVTAHLTAIGRWF